MGQLLGSLSSPTQGRAEKALKRAPINQAASTWLERAQDLGRDQRKDRTDVERDINSRVEPKIREIGQLTPRIDVRSMNFQEYNAYRASAANRASETRAKVTAALAESIKEGEQCAKQL